MVGLVVLVLGGVGIWPGAGPAGAVEQEPIKLTAPSSETREYDALIGTNPVNYAGAPGDARPNSCSQYTYCDSIPLQLSVPESLKNSDTEDYFLRIKVEWDNSSGNNLDAYMYNAPYPDEGPAPIASSATANMPETINLYRPERPEYILTVMNRNGANSGYKVTAALTVEPFGGAPDFGGVNEGGGRPPTTSPPPSSGGGSGSGGSSSFDPEPSGPTNTSPPPPPTDSGFEPRDLAPVDRDESLSALARERGGFEGSLTAPPVTLPEAQGPPPGPVSGAAVALLGGLLPASLVGGGVYWLRRKGGTATAGF